MTAAPRVSVFIASYDRRHYLAEAIASVLRGNYQDYEVIVSDDAGPLENREVVAACGDRRVRYRRNPVRLGIAGNHLAALREAQGEYFAILNDDDVWEPELLATLVPILDNNPGVVCAFADHHIIDARGVVDPVKTEASSRRWKRDRLSAGLHRSFQKIALVDQSVAIVAGLFRRKAIDADAFRIESGSGYDLWLTYLACRSGAPAWYVPRRLARFRDHPASETARNRVGNARAAIFIYSRFCADPDLGAWRKPLTNRLRFAQLSYALALLDNGDPVAARRFLWPALTSRYGARAGAALALTFTPNRMRSSLVRALRASRQRARPDEAAAR